MMIITRSKLVAEVIPEGTTCLNVEIFVGDQCFMERCGESLQGYYVLPNASFSSSDVTLMKMPADWVVPKVFRSYSVVRHMLEPLRVWYQEESQGIYRIEEVLMAGLERPQGQRERPQGQRERPQGSLQVKAMKRNVTIPLTVPK
jgi:hypothetical protein